MASLNVFHAICTGRARAALPALALALLMVATGCSETGPVFPTSDKLDAWVLAPETRDPRSDRAPEIAGERLRFVLARGERRVALATGGKWGVQETYLTGFDIRADPARIGGAPVVLSRLVRRAADGRGGEVTILDVTLDARRGVSVEGQSCVPAAELGSWHTVELRARLADDDAGFLEVFCDRKPVWAVNALRTTWPPVCRRSAGCAAPVAAPARFDWQVGLISERRRVRAIAVEMKRVFYHRLFVIPNRVRAE